MEFVPDGFRSSSPATPATQSGLRGYLQAGLEQPRAWPSAADRSKRDREVRWWGGLFRRCLNVLAVPFCSLAFSNHVAVPCPALPYWRAYREPRAIRTPRGSLFVLSYPLLVLPLVIAFGALSERTRRLGCRRGRRYRGDEKAPSMSRTEGVCGGREQLLRR